MKLNLSKEERESFSKVIDCLGESLDISETQYNNLILSYNAVGVYLENDPFFAPYNPIVTPQGSLRLGTIIQPISDKDDLDVDLVFRLAGKNQYWTQKTIKDGVGNRFKESNRYSSMLQTKEGRRCWTLLYRDNSDNPKEKYHMDILPAVTDAEYSKRVERMFAQSEYSLENANLATIRITDKKNVELYERSIWTKEWLRSNPDGYAYWFASRCKIANISQVFLAENVIPIGKYSSSKYPLQRIVQILKRHRDIMFANDPEDKPISIIITTLAAQAYCGEKDVLEGLLSVVDRMEKYIIQIGGICTITNPVDSSENFADKWKENPKKKENFFKWLNKVKQDLQLILNSKNNTWSSYLGESFGKDVSQRTSNCYAEKMRKAISTGSVLIGSNGSMGAVGRVANGTNTFFGNEE